MSEIFGVPMTNIALGCLAVTALIFLVVAWIAVRNPVMFKTGLRNIPRRPLQTSLIIVGLMLSTLIITAAFGTGDTMKHSIAEEAYTILGPIDVEIGWDAEDNPAPPDQQVVSPDTVASLEQQFADDPDVFAIAPYRMDNMPILNERSRLNEANSSVTAFRPADLEPFGGLKDASGNVVTLGPDEIGINKALADEIDAEVGDSVQVFFNGQATQLTVKAIMANNIFGGTVDTVAREGAALSWDTMQAITGQESPDFVAFSIDGSVRNGVERSNVLENKLEEALEDTPYEVSPIKEDILEQAELFGNLFTTIFALFGLFSISAGVLLIFLIFIMLAAERKPEMGMARAVGAKRRQIVESFLAEGMGYDLGSAVIGLFAGIGVSYLMIWFVNARIGEGLGLNLVFDVSPRSLLVSFCIGVIVTFIVVFLASWRASRLNIVAAIRDLPETQPVNPERETWMGYTRGALNGMVAFGFILTGLLGLLRFPDLALMFGLLVFFGVPGLFLGMVRNHNFGAPRHQRKQGERLPIRPWIAGVFLAPIGLGVVMILSYGLAILLVRFTRDRRPKSVSPWLLVAGVFFAPLGLVLSALQDRGRPIAWSVGFGVVSGFLGLMFVQWGLDSDRTAWLAMGVSFIALWAVVSLRYFHIRERLVFTTTSLALIVFWFLLPGNRLSFIFGDLNSDVEMFFVTGAVLVTAGTFVIVYNADVILPLVATLGSRLGRIVPAMKTAIAYPLTSRFRTGLTIAMIGLIMFVLSMQAAMNANFERAFAGDDSRGGWDDRVIVNTNNLAEDFTGSLEEAGVDVSRIRAVGEARIPVWENLEVGDPEWLTEDPAERDPEDEYRRYEVMGVDDGFVADQALPLKHRAAGYETDEDVWNALANDDSLAIIPSALTVPQFGMPADTLGLPERYTYDEFEPFTLTLRNPTSGETREVTVIGQMKDSADLFFWAILVRDTLTEEMFPDSLGQQFYLALEPGTDARDFAKEVESALVQAQADSLDKLIQDAQSQNRTFLELFQGFLALGLIVGIAALGVVSLRAVVERRQQIGMLRAIGYSRSMVQLSFILESAFIAIAGIGLGLVLGIAFAANLFTSGEFGATTRGLQFTVPWGQIGLMTGIALVMALFMTYLPARAASRVAIAEALRYE